MFQFGHRFLVYVASLRRVHSHFMGELLSVERTSFGRSDRCDLAFRLATTIILAFRGEYEPSKPEPMLGEQLAD
jgi:hypothetical protein